jgi:3-(3-hydroxy-phenyl)propionate hydroxylase
MSVEASRTAAPEFFDVIIVGAGPTGLTLANLLGLEGVSTLVIDRKPGTVEEPRAVSIDDESLRVMQACGLIDTIESTIVPGYGSNYLTAAGSTFLRVKPVGKPYGFPRRNAFRQPMFERQLLEGLTRFAHVPVRFNSNATLIGQDDQYVELAYDDVAGRSRQVRAKFLVGCDGASSFVRKSLGFRLEGETLPERWLIVDLEQSPAGRDTLVFCDFRRPCIALPGPDQSRRFEFKLFDHEFPDGVVDPNVARGLLDAHGVAPQSRTVRQAVYTFHARVVNHWSSGRVFLAGDAAHLTPPFAGQGMNSGIRDAHNLGWKLASVIRGTFDIGLLASYEMERRDHVTSMIDLALRMGRIMGPKNWLDAFLVQTGFKLAGICSPVRSYFGEMKYKPRPRFRHGFLVPSRHDLVGRLFPQPMVKAGGGKPALLDDYLPRGFALLGIDVSAADLSAAADVFQRARVAVDATVSLRVSGLPGDNGTELQVVSPSDQQLMATRGKIILLRPDHYVMSVFESCNAVDIASASMMRNYVVNERTVPQLVA